MSVITYHNHHIVPKYAGGSDAADNLVRLTVSEHADAHRLRWEQYGQVEDRVAWLMLAGRTEDGEVARLELLRSPKVRAKMSEAMNEYYQSAEAHTTRSIALKGRVRPAQHRRNLSEALRGNTNALGCLRSPETRAKMSAGRKRSIRTA